jgi:hypothetical protein
MTRYLLEFLLFVAAMTASLVTNKQLKKAIKEERYDFGLYRKINPLQGEKAVSMGKFMLMVSRITPWFVAFMLIIFELTY